MPSVEIPVPTLIGGVSRAAQSQRPLGTVEAADNVVISLSRGVEKRAGSNLVGTASLAVTNPTNSKHIGWIDRDEDERFVFLIDPTVTTIVVNENLTTGPVTGNRITQLNTGAELFITASDTATETLYGIVNGTFSTNPADTLTSNSTMVPAILTVSTVTQGVQAPSLYLLYRRTLLYS